MHALLHYIQPWNLAGICWVSFAIVYVIVAGARTTRAEAATKLEESRPVEYSHDENP